MGPNNESTREESSDALAAFEKAGESLTATIRKTHSLDFMRRPDKWPHKPFLPLRRRPAGQLDTELAVLCNREDVKTSLFFHDVFTVMAAFRKNRESTLNRKDFRSFDEIVEDGWVVD